MKETKIATKNFALISSLACWTTIIIQFILMLQNRVATVIETIIRFFTFFTILTNILVAIVFTIIFIKPVTRWTFFLKPNTQTAIAVYIFVVGFVYNAILRFIWQPQGLQRIIDEMLHLIIPLIYVIYWCFKINKEGIIWKNILGWLIYPIVYLIVIVIRGNYSNYYPYPFINISELGISKVVINSFFLTLFFSIMSFAFVGIAKYSSKNI